jgi:aspartyl-tRNA(Asn)/glutamyl-tRNA(Gln) amidotransferase subunit B
MNYEVVIGLEIHAELSTKSKIFCSCSTKFGGDVNTHCCPICTGMPGTLPVLNKKVVEYAAKAGIATNCKIANFSKQDRKNYFYPDLPKAYQISQYDLPLCSNGHIKIKTENNEEKIIGITRIHIEEDAAKLLHDEWDTGSLIDYNRCGVPLIEIVSEPDMRSAEEVRAYMETIKNILEYIDVSDCKMQQGSLRADINLSVRPKGQKEFGTRTEMKNLNSFKGIVRAIEAETKRQINEIEQGEEIIQETRRWDDEKGMSYSMRSKEEAHDYRYFPDPDLVPIILEDEWIENVKNSLPELPNDRKIRYVEELGLPLYDADILTSSKYISDLFEESIKYTENAKAVSNWIMGDLLKVVNDNSIEFSEIPVSGENLGKLINLIDKGTISGTIAKKVFNKMFKTNKNPEDIVKEDGLEVLSDESAINTIVKKVLDNNEKSVQDYKSGKKKAKGFLVGQVMKESKGKADPKVINKILAEMLD